MADRSADLVLLHTAESHVLRFDEIVARIAPGAAVQHHVRPEWLEMARAASLTPGLKGAFMDFVQAQTAPVLCTCTTLGPLADAAGAIRIDRPMMQEAARLGSPVAMAYCVESTCAPSMALLRECLEDAGNEPTIRAIAITDAWPAFEAGDEAAFAQAIARSIRVHLAAFPDTRAVVLAQASMSGAAPLLPGDTPPVLTSPETALRAALER